MRAREYYQPVEQNKCKQLYSVKTVARLERWCRKLVERVASDCVLGKEFPSFDAPLKASDRQTSRNKSRWMWEEEEEKRLRP